MTLFVFSLSFTCHGVDFRCQSVGICSRFHEDDQTDATAKANTVVTAYAPFDKQKRWNESNYSIEDKGIPGVTSDCGQYVTAEASAQRGKYSS